MPRTTQLKGSILDNQRRPQPKVHRRKTPLGREAWLDAAREALIRKGIAAVEVGKLARRLHVSRGGFYWFFDSRNQLLDQLLSDWEHTNTEAFKSCIRQSGHNGAAEFQALVDMWVTEQSYSPQWDAAIRDWARISPRVALVVQRVDDERISILKRIFLDLGYDQDEAFVRARIVYFHQIGYYTLGVQEAQEQRLRLLPLYVRILTGR
jgi:AcrR family transcriptional regulator